MSNFLQLCQSVARESGTFPGSAQPSSVVNQTGRLAKVVSWTAEAWRQVQNLHSSWRWMRKEFSGSLSSGTARYTAASFGLTDFAEWVFERPDGEWNITLYLTATGVSDEGPLAVVDWPTWLRTYGRGSQTNARPTVVAVSPANELCFGPIPDAAYTVRGEYRKTAQVLAANADTPECPERHHGIVIWKGLQLLHEHDEADVLNIAAANRKYVEDLSALERDQLPRLRIGSRPLA